MSTAIKRKAESGKRKAKTRGNGKIPVPAGLFARPLPADAVVDYGLRGESRDLPLEAIQSSPDNPRKDFPDDEIRALAATIQRDGLLQPILVRPRPGYKPAKLPAPYYELVAGERRFRAAKVAGLKKIPCVIRMLSDAEARELRAVENTQRRDLSAIEEARQFRSMLAAGDFPGPTELARALGLSQGHISNRLRLLELPAKWVDRIDSGVLPATHARALVKFKDQPKILSEVERRVFRTKDVELGSVDEFESDVRRAAYVSSEPMDGERSASNASVQVPIFKPTPEQEKELAIIEMDDYGRKPTRRATNTKLWGKLQAAHEKEFLADRGKASRGKSKSANKKPAKALTAAQRKAQEAADRKRRAELAGQYHKRLYQWKVNTLRMLIAQQIAGEGIEPENTQRLLVYFAASRRAYSCSGDFARRENDLDHLCRERGVRPKRGQWEHFPTWSVLAELPNRIDELITGWLARQFWTAKDGPSPSVPDADVEAIAEHLCIDLPLAWKQRVQSGPLWEGYWNLHSKEQLVDLAKELGLNWFDASGTKAGMVKALLDPKKPLKVPREILKVKRPKR